MDPDLLRTSTTAGRVLAGAEQQQERISHGAVDPDYISRMEHFEAMAHAEIFRCVQEMDPGAMCGAAETWVSIASGVDGAVSGLHIAIQGALAEGMQGRIAEAAENSLRQFVQRAADIEETIRVSGYRIFAAAYGAEAVKRSVPPPPITGDDSVGGTTAEFLAALTGGPGPSDAHGFTAFKEEQYRIAVAALEANYVPTYVPAGSSVPAFTSADHLGENDGATALLGSGDAGGSASGTGSHGTVGGSLTPREASPASTAPVSEMPNSTAPEYTSPSQREAAALSATDHDYSAARSPATETADTTPSTTPANFNQVPLTTNSPGTVTPTLGSPYAPGSPFTPGYPGSAPFTGGDPGRGIPSSPTSRTTSAPPPSGTPTRSNANWIPGMYPPAAARGADTESARTTPEWLIWNREHELLGTPPPFPPATIGADIASAQMNPDPVGGNIGSGGGRLGGEEGGRI